MELPFLDREEEFRRLTGLFGRPEGSLAVLYGRRRCGKSRLLLESLPAGRSVYYVADQRESALQRAALAAEVAPLLPGFDRVVYPDWGALLERWWREAPTGAVLALDEFQAVVAAAPELPSLLQKQLDLRRESGCHVVLSGSSQRMMLGLMLDRTAPLFGRARELVRVTPLRAGWISEALRQSDPVEAVESYATWGGVPRYWELAGEFEARWDAVRSLVLDPLGVLHREPDLLLLDDVRDAAQSASILQLVGGGCHRLSEIAGRLGKPASSLSRPLQRLLELGLVRRDRPFGTSERHTKRSLYRVADPFLRFWFRYVAPNRSRLEARLVDRVAASTRADFASHAAGVWEELCRESVPHLAPFGLEWHPAAPWWGRGTDGRPLEIDLVATSVDGADLLVGSVKWEEETHRRRVEAELRDRAGRLPLAEGRRVHLATWVKRGSGYGPQEVLGVLR